MGAPGKTAKAFRWAHGSWHARHAQYGLPRSNHSAKKLASTSLAMPSKLFQASLSITSRGVSELTNLMDLPQALAAVEQEASISSSHSSRFVLEENVRWACPRRLSVQLTSWILRASQAQVQLLASELLSGGSCLPLLEAWCHGSPAGCAGGAPRSSSTTGASEDHERSCSSLTCIAEALKLSNLSRNPNPHSPNTPPAFRVVPELWGVLCPECRCTAPWCGSEARHDNEPRSFQ